MADAAGGVFAAATVLGMQAPAMAGQEQLDLPLVPTVTQTQALAASHAELWISTYASYLEQPLDDVRTYGALVAAFTPGLTDAASTLAEDRDPAALRRFRSDVGYLTQSATSRRATIANSQTYLNTFVALLGDDAVRYATDEALMAKRYTGPGGDIARIQADLDGLTTRLQKDNDQIALAAATAIAGGAVLGVGAAALYLDLPVGKALIQAGLKVGRGAVQAADDAMDDATAAITAYTADAEKLSDELQQVAVFTTLNGHVTQLNAGAAAAVSALNDLDAAWQAEIGAHHLWIATAQQQDRSALPGYVAAGAKAWQSRSAAVLNLINAPETPPD